VVLVRRHGSAQAEQRPLEVPMRRRDIYALLAPGDRPLARLLVDALIETAADF